jgi:hypothetical protein
MLVLLQVTSDPDVKTIDDFKAKFPQGTVLDEGNFTLMSSSTGVADGDLFIAPSKDKDVTLSTTQELFSFGPGNWEEGSSAEELFKDTDAAWLAPSLSPNTPTILEATNLPDELKALDFVTQQTVVSLGTLLSELESNGETKLTITGHSVKRENMGHKVDQEMYFAFKLDAAKA